MKKWPDHFPEQCPPGCAEPVSGKVYRFINRANPKEKDFKSFFELKPDQDWGEKACQARGLSVYKNKNACEQMVDLVPALAKKKLAVAELNSNDGVIAETPSRNSNEHNTLWSSVDKKEMADKFTCLENEVALNA
ncbi:hypothetical protein IOQ59_05805 [Pontibacterium sp. N1Y112]|uniref:Uncharacterized protein n=1 Tax=Pontibacterium sinense TaxID=2781979 RepID=A0A8J7K6E4_9GAMM|nr:hypothetical protein [Pontibacterium sinense]MBE9396776.1 hypothetical protein [Pontibacterium sinense]